MELVGGSSGAGGSIGYKLPEKMKYTPPSSTPEYYRKRTENEPTGGIYREPDNDPIPRQKTFFKENQSAINKQAQRYAGWDQMYNAYIEEGKKRKSIASKRSLNTTLTTLGQGFLYRDPVGAANTLISSWGQNDDLELDKNPSPYFGMTWDEWGDVPQERREYGTSRKTFSNTSSPRKHDAGKNVDLRITTPTPDQVSEEPVVDPEEDPQTSGEYVPSLWDYLGALIGGSGGGSGGSSGGGYPGEAELVSGGGDTGEPSLFEDPLIKGLFIFVVIGLVFYLVTKGGR